MRCDGIAYRRCTAGGVVCSLQSKQRYIRFERSAGGDGWRQQSHCKPANFSENKAKDSIVLRANAYRVLESGVRMVWKQRADCARRMPDNREPLQLGPKCNAVARVQGLMCLFNLTIVIAPWMYHHHCCLQSVTKIVHVNNQHFIIYLVFITNFFFGCPFCLSSTKFPSSLIFYFDMVIIHKNMYQNPAEYKSVYCILYYKII